MLTSRTFTAEQAQFGVSLRDAAINLGICPTTLKVSMQQLGRRSLQNFSWSLSVYRTGIMSMHKALSNGFALQPKHVQYGFAQIKCLLKLQLLLAVCTPAWHYTDNFYLVAE